MISKQTAFAVSDGQLFSSVEAAQQHEIEHFIRQSVPEISTDLQPIVADKLLANKDKLVDLLTMKANSRPRARKANGAVRKKKSTTAEPATATVPA